MIILRRDFAQRGILVSDDSTSDKEEVCADLSAGSRYMEAGSAEPFELSAPYSLKPGHCIVVETSEKITVPKNAFGFLCSKGSLAARGLLVPNTKIDPRFSGTLQVAIYNAGKRVLIIDPAQKFCSVVFHTIEGSAKEKVPRQSPKISNVKGNSIRAFLSENWKFIVAHIVTIVISIGGAYVAVRAATDPTQGPQFEDGPAPETKNEKE